MNINDNVQYTLTASGAAIWNARYEDTAMLTKYVPEVMRAGDVVKTQLWYVMQVFGPHIYLGMGEAFCVNCEMEVV